jgi:hypothetical protein
MYTILIPGRGIHAQLEWDLYPLVGVVAPLSTFARLACLVPVSNCIFGYVHTVISVNDGKTSCRRQRKRKISPPALARSKTERSLVMAGHI